MLIVQFSWEITKAARRQDAARRARKAEREGTKE